MRILHVTSLFAPYRVGGAERAVEALANAQRERGHTPSVLSLHETADGDIDVGGIPVHQVRLRNVYWPYGERRHGPLKPLWHALDITNPWMARVVLRVVRRDRPDVLHTHNIGGFSTAVWRVAREEGIPVVHTLHDYHLVCPRSYMYRSGRNCERQCRSCALFAGAKRAPSAGVNAVVGVTRFVLERHQASGYFRGVPGAVIGNAVPPPPLVAAPRPAGRVPTLGFIGRLTPAKGLALLADAFALVPRGACRLVIAGRGAGPYVDTVRRRLEPLGAEFPGWVEPQAFYPQLDALVVPSVWHEPFGLVVVEAWHHGVPVVATRRGGLSELVDEGRTGWLTEAAPAPLAERLAALAADPARAGALTESCRLRAADFLPDRIAASYEQLYGSAVARAARGREQQVP
jgi:glycosyltransferase involved in cell wall biosynthesis